MHLTSECIMFQICTYLSADSHSIIEMHVVHCVCVCVCTPLTDIHFYAAQESDWMSSTPNPSLPFPHSHTPQYNKKLWETSYITLTSSVCFTQDKPWLTGLSSTGIFTLHACIIVNLKISLTTPHIWINTNKNKTAEQKNNAFNISYCWSKIQNTSF